MRNSEAEVKIGKTKMDTRIEQKNRKIHDEPNPRSFAAGGLNVFFIPLSPLCEHEDAKRALSSQLCCGLSQPIQIEEFLSFEDSSQLCCRDLQWIKVLGLFYHRPCAPVKFFRERCGGRKDRRKKRIGQILSG